MGQDNTVEISTVSASSQVNAGHRGHVIVSGSYGGQYNAYHAAKWGVRGVILCDAGVGKDEAGIKGLYYLDRVGQAAATADAQSCHIADGEDLLRQGTISFVNDAALALGCARGQSVSECAELMKAGTIPSAELPEIIGGKRYTVSEKRGEPRVICLDAAPMLRPEDDGAIAITGSHAALFRGRPDDVINVKLVAVFFSDGGVGKDGAGITRLADLDRRSLPAGAASTDSAEIGNSRDIYENGILSHLNTTATRAGGRPGMRVRDMVDALIEANRSNRS